MLGSVVLLLAPKGAETRRLEACLRGGGNDVCVSSDREQASILIEAQAVDLLIVEAAHIDEMIRQSSIPLLAYSTASEDFSSMLAHEYEYFVGLAGDGDVLQCIRNVALMAERILRRDFFGIDKYIQRFGVDFTAIQVQGASQRDELVNCVHDLAKTVGARRRELLAIASITDELLTNAIYDAPTDAFGEHKYAHMNRQSKVALAPGENVSLVYGSDGCTLAISVVDNFGSLPVDRIRSRLLACMSSNPIEDKAGGAGLGLYSVLKQCDELIINVEPGKRTEIIAFIDLGSASKSPRSSLQVSCVQPEVEKNSEVTLCATLRQELCSSITESKKPLSYVPLTAKRVATGTQTPPLPIIETPLPMIETTEFSRAATLPRDPDRARTIRQRPSSVC
jgi:anti-sigma regulatory factor (Ser/Thr protein kinase)